MYNDSMTVTYPELETQSVLSAVWEKVAQDREIMRARTFGTNDAVHRDGADEDIALIAADELDSILETMHLLRSPANAERLLAALEWSRHGDGVPQSVDELRREVGL